jgi:hypothetical protein
MMVVRRVGVCVGCILRSIYASTVINLSASKSKARWCGFTWR